MILASLGIVPHEPVYPDHCDVAEVNHFYDENGRLVFDQMIFWEWCEYSCRFHVLAWRLWLPGKVVHAAERRGVIVFMDGERLRRVRYDARRESWTQEDLELLERAVLDRDSRKELGR